MHDQIRSADGDRHPRRLADLGRRAIASDHASASAAATSTCSTSPPSARRTDGFRRLIDRVEAGADRDRRSALRQRMGPRLPPRLSPASRPARRPSARCPRLALTATADARTRADILTQLGIPEDGLIVAGFDRPNIRYHVRHREQTGKQLRDLLATSRGRRSSMRRAATRRRRSPRQLGRGRPAVAALSRRASSRRCARATRRRSSIPRTW